MKSKLDTICIVMGCGCIAAALILFLHNQMEQDRAAAASQEAIAKVVEVIQEHQHQLLQAEQEMSVGLDMSDPNTNADVLPEISAPAYPEVSVSVPEMPALSDDSENAPVEEVPMTAVTIDGYDYIGFLSIRSLGLELPVMNDWTEEQLQLSPCRYSGSVEADDLVIMAHNYAKHFARLKDVRTGDAITFTDMNGNTTEYEVEALDILAAGDVEEMKAGEYDLSLFTCNYSGDKRITVRCDRVKN